MGYPYGTKGWRMYDLELGIFFTSRDAVFCENEFSFAEVASPPCLPNAGILPNSSFVDLVDDDDICQHVPTMTTLSSTPPDQTISSNDHAMPCESAPGSCSIESPNGIQLTVEARGTSYNEF